MCGVRQRRGVGEHVHHIAILLTKAMLKRTKFFHLDGKVRVVHAITQLIRGIVGGERLIAGQYPLISLMLPILNSPGLHGDHAHGDLANLHCPEFLHVARPPASKLEKCSLVQQVRHHPGAIVEVAQACRPSPTLDPARLNTLAMVVECCPGPALGLQHQCPCRDGRTSAPRYPIQLGAQKNQQTCTTGNTQACKTSRKHHFAERPILVCLLSN